MIPVPSVYFGNLASCLMRVEASDGLSVDAAFEMAALYLTRTRGIIHVIGNGGSASVAAHTQNGLQQACHRRAVVHQDIACLTAFANDGGYPTVYEAPLALWLQPVDVVIAISSSGASANILSAVRLARQRGAVVITFSGFAPDNPLRQLGALNFYVPSTHYGFVELTHEALLHCLTDRLATHA